MIAILLPPTCIARRDLEMARGIGADPHVGPSRRDDELANALQLRLVANHAAVRRDVREATAAALAPDARCRVRYITKACRFSGFDVLVGWIHGRVETPASS